MPTQEFLQFLIHLPVAYLLVYSARLATPVAPKQGGRRVLWARNRLRVSRLFRTRSLPTSLRRAPVELLRMRRTDSQLALEYYQAATSGPVADGATQETCGALLTWPAVEFAFGSSAWPCCCARSNSGSSNRLLPKLDIDPGCSNRQIAVATAARIRPLQDLAPKCG